MKKIKEKSAVAIVQIIILSVLLFPFILGGIIDATSIYNLNKSLKNSLDIAVKSGTSREDSSAVPTTGIPYIDVQNAFYYSNQEFDKNMNLSLNSSTPYGGGVLYKLDNMGNNLIASGNSPEMQIFVNNTYYGTPISYPAAGSISKDIVPSGQDLGIKVTKPTVYAIARVEYKSVFFGKKYAIVRWSASQLNN